MKFGRHVLHVNMHRLRSRIFDLTSHFQDGGHYVISRGKVCCYLVSSVKSPVSVFASLIVYLATCGKWFYDFSLSQNWHKMQSHELEER